MTGRTGKRTPRVSRSRLAWGTVLLITLLVPRPGRSADAPPGVPASQPATITDPEQALWAEITALGVPRPTTQPYASWFTEARRRRQDLLERVRLYLTLYPGGAARDDAVQIELSTLFELGTLAGGDLSALCARAVELRQSPASPTIEADAAYWQLLCERSERASVASTQPATAPVGAELAHLDSVRRAQLRDYVHRYPNGPHTLRLLAVLFEDARRRDDRAAMWSVIEQVGTEFPAAAQTHALLGTWNRLEAVGRPFAVKLDLGAGRVLDTGALVGRPTVLVVWASHDAASRARLAGVEAYRRTHPELQAIGVSLDASEERMAATCRRLELDWPQFNDGLGWGNVFARTWGLRSVPWVFVIDETGVLRGATQGDEWRSWLSDDRERGVATPADDRD